MDFKILGVYSAVIFLNIFVSFYFYFGSRKHEIYKWSLIFWANGFLFFLSQAVFAFDYKLAALFISLVAINDYAVLKIISLLLKIKTRDLFYLKVSCLIFALGYGAFFFTSFKVYTTILSIGVIFPYFHFLISNFKEICAKSSKIEKLMIFFYSINVAHMLDYAFFTEDPVLYPLGFNIAFGLTMILTLFIHITTDSVYLKRIEEQLKQEIDRKKTLYKTMIANEMINSFSHEINNSLQTIKFQQELIKLKAEQTKEPFLSKSSLKIESSLNKINDILKPFYEEKEVQTQIQLNQLVVELKSFLDPFLKKNQIQLDVFFNSKKDDGFFASKGLMIQMLVSSIKLLSKNHNKVQLIFEDSKIVLKSGSTENIDFDLIHYMTSQLNQSLIVEKDQILIVSKLDQKSA